MKDHISAKLSVQLLLLGVVQNSTAASSQTFSSLYSSMQAALGSTKFGFTVAKI